MVRDDFMAENRHSSFSLTHEVFISVWGQHQRDDDLVTEQWCLLML